MLGFSPLVATAVCKGLSSENIPTVHPFICSILWQQAQVGEKYYLAVVAKDYSDHEPTVITIMKYGHGFKEPDTQVGEFQGFRDRESLPQLVYNLAVHYNNCQIVVDVTNGAGYALHGDLIRLGYKNFYSYSSYSLRCKRLGWNQDRTQSMIQSNFERWERRGLVVIKSENPEVSKHANMICLFCMYDLNIEATG